MNERPRFNRERLRHEPLRQLSAEELSEARRRGYITRRMMEAERYVRKVRAVMPS